MAFSSCPALSHFLFFIYSREQSFTINIHAIFQMGCFNCPHQQTHLKYDLSKYLSDLIKRQHFRMFFPIKWFVVTMMLMLCSSERGNFRSPTLSPAFVRNLGSRVKVQRLSDPRIFWNATSHQSSGAFWVGFVWLIKRPLSRPSVLSLALSHCESFPRHRVNTAN